MSSYYFDEEAADHIVGFYRDHLRFVEGRTVNKPFDPLPWQEQILRDLFGWKMYKGGPRRYRTAYIELPRKNGKSTFAAGIALYMLLCDMEAMPQVYSVASSRSQAEIVFRVAKEMIRADPGLMQHASIWQYRITKGKQSGFYATLPSGTSKLHGLNISCCIFDELHTQKDRELWDVLETSTGARTQPLMFAITTAGHDRSTICWQMHQKAKAVKADPDIDPTFYGCIYGADEEDDWTSPDVWRKANPSLGHSLLEEYLAKECHAAIRDVERQNTFRNLHLNQWTQQAKASINMKHWEACPKYRVSLLKGKRCYAGLDIASVRDLCSLVLVFDVEINGQPSQVFLPHFWMPESPISKQAEYEQQQSRNWANKGLITTCPGNRVDHSAVVAKFLELGKVYDIRELAYDPWFAEPIIQQLHEGGYPRSRTCPFAQTIRNYAGVLAQFKLDLAGGRIVHNNDPVLEWNARNFAEQVDASGNSRPAKHMSQGKIDGIVAGLMAKALADKKKTPIIIGPDYKLEI